MKFASLYLPVVIYVLCWAACWQYKMSEFTRKGLIAIRVGWGCSPVGRALERHAADARSTREFSPSVNFQCRLSYGVRTPPCTIACINVCAHVKDPVVPVSVRWIMGTLKRPACTAGSVAGLRGSWLSPGKATLIFHGINFNGAIPSSIPSPWRSLGHHR